MSSPPTEFSVAFLSWTGGCSISSLAFHDIFARVVGADPGLSLILHRVWRRVSPRKSDAGMQRSILRLIIALSCNDAWTYYFRFCSAAIRGSRNLMFLEISLWLSSKNSGKVMAMAKQHLKPESEWQPLAILPGWS